MPHRVLNRRLYERNAAKLIREAKRTGRMYCALCGCPVSDALRRNHPQKATADHVIPSSVGGTDDLRNLRLACFSCNTKRGAGRSDAPKPTGGTSREW